MGRNVFPPTPPPETEKSSNSGSSQMSRGASVRNGTKPMLAKLNMEKARPQEGYAVRDNGRSPEARYGNQRTVSESRGPPSRQGGGGGSVRNTQRSDGRPPPRRRPSEEDEEDAYPDELYDMYRNSKGSKANGQGRRPQQRNIEEEEEYASDYDGDEYDDGEFEMVSKGPPARTRATSQSAGGGGRGGSRRPDVRKIRVKVHAEDVRYIMIGAAVEFPDLVEKIREKFALRKRFKIKVRDEDVPNGDMITMGDQDDLDMVLMGVKAQAKRERLDMGKMEVRYPQFSHHLEK